MSDPRPLPSSSSVAAHLKRYRPRRSTGSIVFIIIALFSIALAASAGDPSGPIGLLPWLVLIGLIFWSTRRGRRMQAMQRELLAVHEMTLTRRWREAIGAAWGLLPKLAEQPQAHAQIVSLLGAALAQMSAHEAAIAAYDHLLRYLPSDNPAGRFIRLQRLRSLLRADRLTDANDEIAKLSRVDLGPIEAAHLALADLQQRVHTNHTADVADDDEAHLAALRPLGTEAAQGYALIAQAMRRTGRDDAARRWWHRATMLMTPSAIVWAQPDAADLIDLPGAPTLASVAAERVESGAAS